MLSAFLLAVLAQVGPNPTGGSLADMPDDIVERPARETVLAAPDTATSAWLAECLGVLADDPARAHTLAQVRRTEVQGASRVIANHCLGLAATELALWDDASRAFIAARDETPAGEHRARARFGLMAGNALLGKGDAGAALAALNTAQADAREAASTPLQALAATDRARALVALDRPVEALVALENATMLAPDRAEIALLEATLLRRLERLDEAQVAIERAGAITPLAPNLAAEIGLEAGVIAVLSGREDAARASWDSVLELAPETPSASTAREYLAQIGTSGGGS